MTDFAGLRERMVERQIRARGISDSAILNAFREVPRELFVAPEYAQAAYDDNPLPIEAGQTISQPYIVAFMIAAAEVCSRDRVLEIGAGSGYAAALLSRIAGQVIAVERHGELVSLARDRIRRLGYNNVKIVHGDGTRGTVTRGLFDAILVAASGRRLPSALIEQLAVGGRLVMPLGEAEGVQDLVKVTRRADGSIRQSRLTGVRFVPLIGEDGWSDA